MSGKWKTAAASANSISLTTTTTKLSLKRNQIQTTQSNRLKQHEQQGPFHGFSPRSCEVPFWGASSASAPQFAPQSHQSTPGWPWGDSAFRNTLLNQNMCRINAHVKSVIPASFLGMSAMLLTNKSRLLMSPFNRSWALQSQQQWVSEWGSNPQISEQSFGLTLLLFTQKFKRFL